MAKKKKSDLKYLDREILRLIREGRGRQEICNRMRIDRTVYDERRTFLGRAGFDFVPVKINRQPPPPRYHIEIAYRDALGNVSHKLSVASDTRAGAEAHIAGLHETNLKRHPDATVEITRRWEGGENG